MGELFEAILLGVVQGLTEFLPISSSGHLALGQALLGWEDPEANLAFNIAVHVGSLVAVVVFVRRELCQPRLWVPLIVATLPIVAVGLPLKGLVETLSTMIWVVGIFLLCTAGLLALVRRISEGTLLAAEMGWRRALLIGAAQVFAILPGVSRSGTTLVAGLGVGLERDQAVRFAFLLAVPAIGAAAFLPLFGDGWPEGVSWGAVLAGAIVSMIVSFLAMKLLVIAVARRRLGWFAAYCACVGLLAVVFGVA